MSQLLDRFIWNLLATVTKICYKWTSDELLLKSVPVARIRLAESQINQLTQTRKTLYILKCTDHVGDQQMDGQIFYNTRLQNRMPKLFYQRKRSAAVFTHSFNFGMVDMHLTGLLLIKPRRALFHIFAKSTVKYTHSYSLNKCKCSMAAGWHLTLVLPETSKMKKVEEWKNRGIHDRHFIIFLFNYWCMGIFRIGGWQTTRSADH